MARARMIPRHTAAPEESERQPVEPVEQEEHADRRRGSRGATTSRHGRRAADHEHHSMFEDRSVLDALWSAVVAAPTSVMPPQSPDAVDLDDEPPVAEADPVGGASRQASPGEAPPGVPVGTEATVETAEAPRSATTDPEGVTAALHSASTGMLAPTASAPEGAAPADRSAAPQTSAAPRTSAAAAAGAAPSAPPVSRRRARAAAATEPFVPVLGRPTLPPTHRPDPTAGAAGAALAAGMPGMASPMTPPPATHVPQSAPRPAGADHPQPNQPTPDAPQPHPAGAHPAGARPAEPVADAPPAGEAAPGGAGRDQADGRPAATHVAAAAATATSPAGAVPPGPQPTATHPAAAAAPGPARGPGPTGAPGPAGGPSRSGGPSPAGAPSPTGGPGLAAASTHPAGAAMPHAATVGAPPRPADAGPTAPHPADAGTRAHPTGTHPAGTHPAGAHPAGAHPGAEHPAGHPPRVTGPFDLSYAAPPSTNRTIWAGPRHAAPPDWTSLSALLTIEKSAAVTDAGLLVLRLTIGLIMAAHGAQKAFGMFGGDGLGATADGFSALGYQPGILFALAAVVGELFGGLFLAIGLLTPLAAGGIIGVTVNAMVAVNLGNGFFASHDGIELPLILTGGALALLLAGPGRYAADARIPFFNGAAVQCAAAGIALLAMLASLGAHLL